MTLDLRYIPCRCFSASHFIRFEQDDDVPDELTASILSTRNGSIWHRIRWALKHVFGKEDLIFADLIISKAELSDAFKALGGQRC